MKVSATSPNKNTGLHKLVGKLEIRGEDEAEQLMLRDLDEALMHVWPASTTELIAALKIYRRATPQGDEGKR